MTSTRSTCPECGASVPLVGERWLQVHLEGSDEHALPHHDRQWCAGSLLLADRDLFPPSRVRPRGSCLLAGDDFGNAGGATLTDIALPTMLRRHLPPHPTSVGEARRIVRRLLTTAGDVDLVDPAELLVSEIVTNAVLHAGTAIDLRCTLIDHSLLVEVDDGGRQLPSSRGYDDSTVCGGRGLVLLEHVAERWGVIPTFGGKTVWFLVSAAQQHEELPGRR
jgi:anti-sigma regulatory factor (Ser/Thr protein kinase)